MRLLVTLVLGALGCGGTAVIDPAGAGGAGAGGTVPTVGTTTTSSAASVTTTTTGPAPPPGVDGVAIPLADGWRFRVTSHGTTCATADEDPPFAECSWYDIDILLSIDVPTPGLVITPESGLGTASASANGPGPVCEGVGSGGGLFGDITIVGGGAQGLDIELGPGWDIVSLDPALFPAGPHRLAVCE